MVYQPNIPLATDKIRISQGDINQNFQDLDSIFDVDHVKYSDATGDAGKHVYTTFVNLTDKGLASPTTSAEEMALYVKDVAGTPRLFYREPSSGSEIQWSGPLTGAANGECALPGGLGMKWGTATNVTSTGTAFTYAGDFSLTAFGTATYSIVAIATSQTDMFVTAKSNTGFTLQHNTTGSNKNAYWIAIGK